MTLQIVAFTDNSIGVIYDPGDIIYKSFMMFKETSAHMVIVMCI